MALIAQRDSREPRPAAVAVRKRDVTIAQAVKKKLLHLVAQVPPGRFHNSVFGEAKVRFDGLSDAFVNVLPPAADTLHRTQQRQAAVPQ